MRWKKMRGEKWEIILLSAIVFVGVFLRAFHFSDWLLFEVDQSYDTRIVSRAIQDGIGNLPLLGPTAGGGRALRLGPAFYYMEYASALVFGDTPAGHAALVLILSILSIPLFHVFCRRYFDVGISLTLTALFSVSVYLVSYGRFSWSPNVLPFLALLSFSALLQSVSSSESKRDRWFLVATAAITVTTQIHFNAFFSLPIITPLFLIYKRPRFSWKTWVAAVGIVFLLYSPVILSDIQTHGENTGFFLKKISKGSPLFEDTIGSSITDLQYLSSEYVFIITGIDHINGKRLQDLGLQHDAHLPWRLFAIFLALTEVVILLIRILRSKQGDRRDFLVLTLLWAAIPFCYFYSLLASGLRFYPRFALLVAPMAFLLFGLILEAIAPKRKISSRKIFLVTITLLFFIPNLSRIQGYFATLADPKRNPAEAEREDIFPNDKRLTLEEQLAITNSLLAKNKENGFPVYLDAYSEYEPVLWYHLSKAGVPYTDEIKGDSLYKKGNYFLIRSPNDSTRSAEKEFTLSDRKNFGVLTVYTLHPKPENIKAEEQLPTDKKELLQTTQILDLTTWNSLIKKTHPQ